MINHLNATLNLAKCMYKTARAHYIRRITLKTCFIVTIAVFKTKQQRIHIEWLEYRIIMDSLPGFIISALLRPLCFAEHRSTALPSHDL